MQVIALDECLPRLKALRVIESGDYDGRDYQRVYQLWKLAYGDEEKARQAQAKAVSHYVDSKCST